jgi:hypothetical protein
MLIKKFNKDALLVNSIKLLAKISQLQALTYHKEMPHLLTKPAILLPDRTLQTLLQFQMLLSEMPPLPLVTLLQVLLTKL